MVNFSEHWQELSPEGKKALAERLDTSFAYLSMLANGHRCPSPRFAELLEIVTGKRFEFEGCRDVA